MLLGFTVTTLQKKKKNYPKDKHKAVISTKMVLHYTVASAAERLPEIGYVLKAKPRKLFDKCGTEIKLYITLSSMLIKLMHT